MSRPSTRRMTAGVLLGAVLGLGPTVLAATGQMSPPESPPVSPPTSTTVVPERQAVPIGGTWYADGQNAKFGPVGSTIRAFATGAVLDVPYRLVLGGGDPGSACVTTAQVLNPTTRFADSTGFLSITVGTVRDGIAPGTYKLCFEDSSSGNLTGTSGATFTVLPSP